jgi:hypothetical protein
MRVLIGMMSSWSGTLGFAGVAAHRYVTRQACRGVNRPGDFGRGVTGGYPHQCGKPPQSRAAFLWHVTLCRRKHLTARWLYLGMVLPHGKRFPEAPRRLSDYPCAGCKFSCLAHISAPFRPIATAMNLQTS